MFQRLKCLALILETDATRTKSNREEMKDSDHGTKETTLMEEKEAEVRAVAAISILPSSSNYAMTNNASFAPTTRLSRQTHHRPPGAFAMRPGASGSGVATGGGNTSSSSALSSFFHGLRPSNSVRGARNRATHAAAATRTTFDDESSSSSFSVGSRNEHHGTASMSDVHIVPVAQLVSPQHGIAAYDVEIAQEVYHGVSVPHPNVNEAAVTPAPEPDGIFWTAPHDGMKASATATALSKRSRRRRHTNANQHGDNGTGGWCSVRCIALAIACLALVLGLILAMALGYVSIDLGNDSSGNNGTTATMTTAPAPSQSPKKYPRYPLNGYDKDTARNTTQPTSEVDNGNRNVTGASSSSNSSINSNSNSNNNTTTNAEPMPTIEQELLPAFSNSSTNATTNNATNASTTTIAPTTLEPNTTNATTAKTSASPNATQTFKDSTSPTASPSISPSLPTEDMGKNTALNGPPSDDSPSFFGNDNNGQGDNNNEPGGDNRNEGGHPENQDPNDDNKNDKEKNGS